MLLFSLCFKLVYDFLYYSYPFSRIVYRFSRILSPLYSDDCIDDILSIELK